MKTKINSLLALFLAGTFMFVSCKKEDAVEPAPEIPPVNTFKMEFGDFATSNRSATDDTTLYTNWTHSAANVVVWNTIITVGLAVPVASFAEAFNHEAVYNSTGSYWAWSYNFNVGLALHTAELRGSVSGGYVNWEMRIDNFLWYTGSSKTDGTEGQWILNENVNNPNELLQIDWNRHANGAVDITYTNIKPGGPENGGYISYGTVVDDLDRFYDIYNKGQDNLTSIKWNSIYKNGNVSDFNKFGDDELHCWGTDLKNMDCN